MRRLIPALLLLVPLAEIALLILVGDAIGVVATLAAVAASALVGVILLRAQGVATIRQMRGAFDPANPPVRAVVDRIALAVAAILLIVPGLLSDLAALLLILPPTRRLLARLVGLWFVVRGLGRRPGGAGGPGGTIDGTWREVDRDDPALRDGNRP
ncbi:MAG: FxsA family protein [Alphaproteobacteria bacterium]|nr:FxsA family protein [Alphaproteobacteria bacterium]